MELAQYIYKQIAEGKLDELTGRKYLEEALPDDVAVVGMSCEYSGAPDLFSFERMLRAGRNGFAPFPEGRKEYFPQGHRYLAESAAFLGVDPATVFDRMTEQRGSYLHDVDEFDAAFFEIPEAEARYIDPAHRLVLKHVFLALEHAGVTRQQIKGTRTAVYIGKDRSVDGSYASEIENDSELINAGTWEGILASRVNYLWDLTGGSLVVDTACSSSLVAMHIARGALTSGEVDTALVGGVALGLAPRQGSVFGDRGGVETVRDYLTVFDDQSRGTIFGEGAGIVVLKRLRDAITAGDHVYAVLRASGINSDGRSNGLTAPNPKAQARLIEETYRTAGISPRSIGYVDAHGTGTRLGDPIEVRGLTDAFRKGGRDDFGTCALTTLKENVGHTVGAAGVGGVIKMSLALDSGVVFPASAFTAPNDFVRFADTPFYVPDGLQEWPSTGGPRRGAVSSFGFSGTNAHVVLEAAPGQRHVGSTESDGPLPFLLSAPTSEQLLDRIDDLLDARGQLERLSLVDVAATLVGRRERFDERLGFTASDHRGFFAALTDARLAATDPSGWRPERGEVHRGTASTRTDQERATTAFLIERSATVPGILTTEDRVRLAVAGADELLTVAEAPGGHVVGLPGLRLRGERLWATVRQYEVAPTAVSSFGTPVDGVLIGSQVLAGPTVDLFTVHLDLTRWCVADHRIGGLPTLSGTAYTQLAADLARHYFGTPAYELTRMTFRGLLQVEHERTVFVEVRRGEAGRLEVEVFVREGTANTAFATFRIAPSTEQYPVAPVAPFEVAEHADLQGHSSDMLSFSGRWDTTGRPLGLRRRDDRVIETEHRLDPMFTKDLEAWDLSPAVVDLLAGAMSWERGVAVGRQFLPLSYGAAHATGARMTATNRARTTLRYDTGADPRVVSADVTILNDRDELVLAIDRYSMREYVAGTSPSRAEVDLHPIGVEAPAGGLPTGEVVLLVEEDDRAAVLAPIPVEERDRVSFLARSGLDAPSAGRADHLVVVLPRVRSDPSSVRAAAQEFLEVARALPRLVRAGGQVVVLVRAGLGAIGDHDVDAMDHARIAAVRVVEAENPGLRLTVVSDAELDVARALAIASEELWQGRRALVRDGMLYGEFLRTPAAPATARRLSEGATVLVTGGFGGMGVEYLEALWRDHGASAVVVGRRALEMLRSSDSDDDRQRAGRVDLLVAEGMRIDFAACDLGDAEAFGALLRTIEASHTIAGVVHLAGVPEAGMLFRKTSADLDVVFGPKAVAASVVAEHFLGRIPELFLAASTMTTLAGAPGQFGYTLANAYLEGIARSGVGLDVTRWPGLQDTGMALRFGVGDASDESFLLAPLRSADAAGYVADSIRRRGTDTVVGRLTDTGAAALAATMTVPGLDEPAVEAPTAAPGAGAGDLVIKDIAEIEIVGVDRPLDELEQFVTVLFASILEVNRVDVTMSFTDMGGDSLKAFSIYTPLVEQLEVDLEVADVFVYPSVLELSGHVRELQDA
ncbi:beta-ketoacyl synthase N-terminal-like domain-containing protein [Curtobacterium poinsettiae]|uniref:beta-ketoacyl synthase N-terminal-like domain-containing protein n=1 Tax=Curtobacterium poinsettiae TaxID=159612 RepID=UPI0023602D23|nr:beta-ketoacyl synthase N-terminal-like domain-containing protein [Curtobacterium flaccumfaciens]MDD1386001.1 beta-ketoacyl synthase N-terminal-like domain-containing protein [Curtobacterium flaccumfaciens pv. poinsettiae]